MENKEGMTALLAAEEAREKGKTSAGEREGCACAITFPPGHALCRLRELWTGERTGALVLDLLPSEEEQALLPEEKRSEEREALRDALSELAEERADRVLDEPFQSPPSDLDELAFVHVSGDEMLAWLFLLPPIERGRELTVTQLQQALVRQGVTSGVDWRLLRGLTDEPDRYFRLFPVARGTAPVRGTDGRVEDRYPRSVQPEVRVDELGSADYETLHLVRSIEKGGIICEITPPGPGSAGNTVTGKRIPAPEGAAAQIPQGRNTGLSEDGKYLVALREGHLEFSGRSFQVKPVLDVSEEVAAYPHCVKFLGDIHIHGDLCSGAVVRAMGNIQVDGVIEACTVEAGENIIVTGGVQGQDGAVLHAQKNVYAKYLEHCTVYARESVQADCIINSSVYSNGTVRACTGRGAVIGGIVRAAREVHAVTVGSKAETLTSIVLGGLPCEQAERTQILAEIEGNEKQLAQLELRRSSPEGESEKSKLRLNLCVAKMKLEKFDKDLGVQIPPVPGEDTRRLVCTTAYPGTTVTIDHDSYKVTQVEHDCVVGFANGFLGKI